MTAFVIGDRFIVTVQVMQDDKVVMPDPHWIVDVGGGGVVVTEKGDKPLFKRGYGMVAIA